MKFNVENYKRDILFFLDKILNSKDLIEEACQERVIAHIKKINGATAAKVVENLPLAALDAYEIFDATGKVDGQKTDLPGNYKVAPEERLTNKTGIPAIDNLPDRVRYIFEAALFSAAGLAEEKNRKAIIEWLKIDSEEESELHTSTVHLDLVKNWEGIGFTSPLGYEPNFQLRRYLTGGFVHVRQSNIYAASINDNISNADFINNLTALNVRHIFSFGNVFSKYLIPDSDGAISLTSIPEFANYQIQVKIIRQVEKFTTYEVSINGGSSIFIHQHPDISLVKLSEEELAYAVNIQNHTLPEQGILCESQCANDTGVHLAALLGRRARKDKSDELLQAELQHTQLDFNWIHAHNNNVVKAVASAKFVGLKPTIKKSNIGLESKSAEFEFPHYRKLGLIANLEKELNIFWLPERDAKLYVNGKFKTPAAMIKSKEEIRKKIQMFLWMNQNKLKITSDDINKYRQRLSSILHNDSLAWHEIEKEVRAIINDLKFFLKDVADKYYEPLKEEAKAAASQASRQRKRNDKLEEVKLNNLTLIKQGLAHAKNKHRELKEELQLVAEVVGHARLPVTESISDSPAVNQATREAIRTAIKKKEQIDQFKKELDKQAAFEKSSTPKLLVFDIDDTLLDLEGKDIKHKDLLYPLLQYANRRGIKIAICTNRTDQTDLDDRANIGNHTVAEVIEKIQREAGVTIDPRLVFNASTVKEIRHRLEQQYDLACRNKDVAAQKRLQTILEGKNYQLDALRLAYQSIEGVLPSEQSCIFVDDKDTIYAAAKQANYRAVKATDPRDESVDYLAELAYELGAYRPLINFLNGKSRFIRLDQVPNFEVMGFKQALLVLTIPLSDFYRHAPKLIATPNLKNFDAYINKLRIFNFDFTMTGMLHFKKMNSVFQQSFIKYAFQFLRENLARIQSDLLLLKIEQPDTIGEEWIRLRAEIERYVELERLYSKEIAPTYMAADFCELQILLNHSPAEIALNTHAGNSYLSLPLSDEMKACEQRLVILKANLGRTIPVSLQQEEMYGQQKTNFLHASERKLIAKWKIEFLGARIVLPSDTVSFDQLITFLETEFNSFSPTDYIRDFASQVVKKHQGLHQVSHVLNDMHAAVSLFAEAHTSAENYLQRISNISARVKYLLSELEASEQYQAKEFLQNAETYFYAPDTKWDIHFQWKRHVLPGTEKRIPEHVDLQLKEIEDAKLDGNYLAHKHTFVRIGKNANSFFSSSASKEYKQHFKLERESKIVADLNTVFTSRKMK